MTNVPLRPAMPMDELHRSLPSVPYDMDPRMDPHNPRVMSAPFDTRLTMDGPDYISTMGPLSNRSPGGPFPPSGFDPEMLMMGASQQHMEELVRRTNLLVQFVNGQISPVAGYSQLQPKMCSDAKFPPEFRTARTIEEIKAMDPTTLDRILRAYGLPTDLRSLRMTFNDSVGPRTAHQAKLCTLFDFLGAVQVAERQRVRKMACLPY